MENKTMNNGSTRLTAERAERDKDPSEQQVDKNITNHQSFVKETGSWKQVPVSVSCHNKLELTGVLLTNPSLNLFSQTTEGLQRAASQNNQSPAAPLWFSNDRGSLKLFWTGKQIQTRRIFGWKSQIIDGQQTDTTNSQIHWKLGPTPCKETCLSLSLSPVCDPLAVIDSRPSIWTK